MRWPILLLTILLWSVAAPSQSVISVRSGLINYSEGAVFIDNQLVGQKPGKYPTLREGSDLLTHDGRAEILLTPEVYLRIGINSSVRMISSSLSDTRVQLLSGSAILDSGNAPADPTVTLIACETRIRVEKPTRLRVNSDAAQLRVEKGDASVERDGKVTRVEADQMLALTGAPVVRRMTGGTDDALDEWSQQRNRSIYLSMANDRNILDPGADSGTGATDADLDAWLGYMPPAAVLPLTGSYGAVNVPGYGYLNPYTAMALYGPVYGYPLGYPGLGYVGYGYLLGLRRSSVSVGSGYRQVPGYRFTPIAPTPMGTFSPRPVGGIRIGVPGTPGISYPARPVAPRPAVPHIPVHR